MTPGTGSREGGADARGGDCAGGRGRSAERRGGARQAERRERGCSDMERGEQGRRRLAPGGRAEPRGGVWATPTGPASVAEPWEPVTGAEREEGPRRGSGSVSECAPACPSACARSIACGCAGRRRVARGHGGVRMRAGRATPAARWPRGHRRSLEVMAFRWDHDL